jgi:membrane protease YdiL (CAAX protease family)
MRCGPAAGAAAALVAAAMLWGCAHAPLPPEERAGACRVSVEDRSGEPVMHGNPAFSPGAAQGWGRSVCFRSPSLVPSG